MNDYQIEILKVKDKVYFTVFYEGDDVVFDTEEDAQAFIDSLERS